MFWLFSCASLCLCGEAPGADPGAEPPLSVSADRAVSQRAGKDAEGRDLTRARFTGNVVAVRGDVTLKCAELEVLFARDARDAERGEAAERGRARQARASGSVVVTMPGRRAVADEAVYDVAAERITLSGKTRPVIYHEGDAVAAESFVLHRTERVAEARGRTSAMIAPRKAGAEADANAAAGDAKAEPLKAGPSAGRKTRIDSTDGAVYRDAERELFMRGEVVVQQEGFRLRCGRLWACFERRPEKPAEGPGQDVVPGAGALSRLVAAGGVRLETEARTAESELAEYDAAKRTVTLAGEHGQPEIREGGSRLTAPQIVYHLAEDRVEPRGGPFKAVIEGRGGDLPGRR
ncbi:MAG TPA: LptA/OstA family protein [Planctomycetota bacterium]|nr:LptA/OstA family protein [Planctomycetota bacterium]